MIRKILIWPVSLVLAASLCDASSILKAGGYASAADTAGLPSLTVPESATIVIMALGLLLAGVFRPKRK